MLPAACLPGKTAHERACSRSHGPLTTKALAWYAETLVQVWQPRVTTILSQEEVQNPAECGHIPQALH